MTMLSGYRVLDLTDERGILCGALLARLGAEVIAVEPPGGNPVRRAAPRAANGDSFVWEAYAAGKRSVMLDLANAADRGRFLDLAATADLVIESFPPDYLAGVGLGYADLSRCNPGLSLVSITPYGRSGPYADFRASDLTVWSMGGHAYLCGDRDRPPVRVTAPQTWLHAAAEGLTGALIALAERAVSGQGQHVDVSAQECVLWTLLPSTGYPQPRFAGTSLRRDGISIPNPYGLNIPAVFPCRDGYIIFLTIGGAVGGRSMQAALRAMAADGVPTTDLESIDWDTWSTETWQLDLPRAQREIDAVGAALRAWFAPQTMEEIYDRAISDGILLGPVYTPRELYRSPHLAARDYWQTVTQPDGTGRRLPGPFVRASATPFAPAQPAPALGEASGDRLLAGRPPTPTAPAPRSPGRTALAGLKVADFSWVGVGPLAAKYLADHGATVVRVESNTRPETLRVTGPFAEGKPGLNRSFFFADVNTNKLGISLDLNAPGARDVALRLVQWADVVLESYTAGTMRRWGLDYESLRAINPGLIMLSATQQGQTGPHAQYAGYGNLLQGTAGFKGLAGWPDREPAGPYFAYTDFICHRLAGASILAALDHRRRTGEGQYLDFSQMEAALHFLSPYLLAYDATGDIVTRDGNRHPDAAPHGIFPAAGDDRWIALACWSDDDWQRLAALIDEPWARDSAYATLAGRQTHEADLETQIGRWTAQHDAHDLMARLQAAGLDAGAVQTGADLYKDPQLAHRNHFAELEHEEIGPALFDGPAFKLSATPGALFRPAPCLGADNLHVYSEILGYSDDEIADLLARGVMN